MSSVIDTLLQSKEPFVQYKVLTQVLGRKPDSAPINGNGPTAAGIAIAIPRRSIRLSWRA